MIGGKPEYLAVLRQYGRAFDALVHPLKNGDAEAVRSVQRLAASLLQMNPARGLRPILSQAVQLLEADEESLITLLPDLLSSIDAVVDGPGGGGLQVLLVDGDTIRRQALAEQLRRSDRTILSVGAGAEALDLMQTHETPILLATLELSDMDGRDLLCRIRASPETTATPVFMLGFGDEAPLRAECIALGADVFIPEPWYPSEINDLIGVRVARRAERSEQAGRDAVTGVLNRSAFHARVSKAISHVGTVRQPVSLALIDLDHFTEVNEAFGWEAGDEVLRYIGEAVRENVDAASIVGRVGGGDFAVLLPGVDRERGVEMIAAVLHSIRTHAFHTSEGKRFNVTFTAGVVQIGPSDSLGTALARAGRIVRSSYAARGNRVVADGALQSEARPTILLAEDNELISSVVVHRLEREGFEVALCTDGDAALKRALEGPVSLIITNVNLPGMDGFTLVARLRNIPPADRTPVVFLTSRGRQEDLVRGFEIGADDYMVKPFSPTELVARVHRLLRIRS